MRIFITGATGVIGRRAIPLLLAEGHTVTAGVRGEPAREAFLQLGARAVLVDLFDPERLRRALADHDVVVNLATHIPSSSWKMMFRGAWRENDRIRSVGARNVVDAALASGVAKIIQESFAPTYPDRGDAWIDESTPLEPAEYSRTVLDAETEVERFVDAGRAGVVLRFAGFYGPDADQTQTLIAGVRRGWALLPGGAQRFISSISHDDAARAVVAALKAPNGPYNVGDDEPMRRADYFGTLARALGVAPPRFLPAWTTAMFGQLGELLARSVRISNQRLRAATGWRPRYPSVREGWAPTLAEMAAPDMPHAIGGRPAPHHGA